MKRFFLFIGFIFFICSCATPQFAKRSMAQVADGNVESTKDMVARLKLEEGKPVLFTGWSGFGDDPSFCLNVVFVVDSNGIVRYYSKEWQRPSTGCDYNSNQPTKVTAAFCVEDPIQKVPLMNLERIPALDSTSGKYLQGMRSIDIDNKSISGEGCSKSGPLQWPINSAIVRDSIVLKNSKEMVLNVGTDSSFSVFLP